MTITSHRKCSAHVGLLIIWARPAVPGTWQTPHMDGHGKATRHEQRWLRLPGLLWVYPWASWQWRRWSQWSRRGWRQSTWNGDCLLRPGTILAWKKIAVLLASVTAWRTAANFIDINFLLLFIILRIAKDSESQFTTARITDEWVQFALKLGIVWKH